LLQPLQLVLPYSLTKLDSKNNLLGCSLLATPTHIVTYKNFTYCSSYRVQNICVSNIILRIYNSNRLRGFFEVIRAFRLMLNLYPGEGHKALLFILLALFWGVGGFGLQILSEGVFVENLGSESLPASYFLVAISLCVVSALMIRALKLWTINHLFKVLALTWASLYLIFFLIITFTTPSSFFWFGLKALGWMAPVSMNVAFWSLGDHYFDLQDGKRFFALFNAIVFTGDLLGSAIVSFGLQYFSLSTILLFFSCCLFACFPLTIWISRKTRPLLEEGVECSQQAASKTDWKEGFSILWNSPFTLALLGTYLVMQIIAVNCEYHYMSCFEKFFAHKGEHQLTEFIGFCNIWISMGNMLLSLLIYSRMVQKIGLNNLVIIAPLSFLMLFTVWLYAPFALPLAVCGTVAREGILYVFDDNNLNLLVSAVPHKIRNQIRISLESFFEPVGMLLTSFLLFVLPHAELQAGFIFTLTVIPLSFLLRRYYPKGLFENLVAGAIQFGKKVSDWFPQREKREVEFLLLAQLKKGNERCQLLAVKYLLQFDNKRLLIPVLHHIDLLSLMGKLDALELLIESPYAKDSKTLDKLERWLKTYPHEPIQLAIHHYLARLGLIRPEKIVQDLDDPALSKSSIAVLAMKTSPFAAQFPSLVKRADEKLNQLLQASSMEEVLVGLSILGQIPEESTVQHLINFLKTSSKEIARVSARSLASVASIEFATHALEVAKRLATCPDAKTRHYLLIALEKFENPAIASTLLTSSLHFFPSEKIQAERIIESYGLEMVPTLIHFLENTDIHERCRLLAGKVLVKLQPNLVKKRLQPLIQNEVKRALFYFYHAQTIKQQLPGKDSSIIENALISGYHSSVDFMIQLIGAASNMEASEVLSLSLWSDNKKTAAQALEAIEKLTPPKLFALIEPLLKSASEHKRWLFFLKLGGTPLSLKELLDKMSSSPSPTDQIVAVGMKAKLGIGNWRHLVRAKMKTQETLFKHFAEEMEESDTPELIGSVT
jgi:hypothetical protein